LVVPDSFVKRKEKDTGRVEGEALEQSEGDDFGEEGRMGDFLFHPLSENRTPSGRVSPKKRRWRGVSLKQR